MVRENCRFSGRSARDYLRLFAHRDEWQKSAAPVLTPFAALRVVRAVARAEREAARAAHRAALPPAPDAAAALHACDFSDLPVAPGAAALVVLDPPWGRAHLPAYGLAAGRARGWLRPGGLALVYLPHQFLPDVVRAVGEHLTYLWPLVVAYARTRTGYARGAFKTRHKLVLAYANGTYRHPPAEWASDLYEAALEPDRARKAWHPWEQHAGALGYYLARLTRPGDLVVDPFLGGGTTAAVVKALGGRGFVGGDRDPAAVDTTRRRLAGVEAGSYREPAGGLPGPDA